LNFFLKGVVIGFSIAVPVGPIGILCIRRSLAHGPRVGLATGMGAATADAFYGGIAGFGLTAISAFLINERNWLGLIGGLFLCYLGVRTFVSKPEERASVQQSGGLLTAYSSTLLLTLTNPMTILAFVAIFAGFGLAAAPNYESAGVLVLGVFLGSALWWLMLSSGTGMVRSRVGTAWMRTVNRLSGSVIFAFGVYALLKMVK
jgi:threonine/homoserine/homoserine lactone efflux protein